jgi:hypothetical protein
MTIYIKDFGKGAAALAVKYGHEHPGFPRSRHKAESDPSRPYWAWVKDCLQQQQDELDRDNPFTQHLGEL